MRFSIASIGFKSLFPLSNPELTSSAECISKVMHSADALLEVCALLIVCLRKSSNPFFARQPDITAGATVSGPWVESPG